MVNVVVFGTLTHVNYEERYSRTGVRHDFEVREYDLGKVGMGAEVIRANRSLCGTVSRHQSTKEHDNPTTYCNTCDRKRNNKPFNKGKRKTPWQKIRDASERGTGCQLTPDDVLRLSGDNAIMERAGMDDEGED